MFRTLGMCVWALLFSPPQAKVAGAPSSAALVIQYKIPRALNQTLPPEYLVLQNGGMVRAYRPLDWYENREYWFPPEITTFDPSYYRQQSVPPPLRKFVALTAHRPDFFRFHTKLEWAVELLTVLSLVCPGHSITADQLQADWEKVVSDYISQAPSSERRFALRVDFEFPDNVTFSILTHWQIFDPIHLDNAHLRNFSVFEMTISLEGPFRKQEAIDAIYVILRKRYDQN